MGGHLHWTPPEEAGARLLSAPCSFELGWVLGGRAAGWEGRRAGRQAGRQGTTCCQACKAIGGGNAGLSCWHGLFAACCAGTQSCEGAVGCEPCCRKGGSGDPTALLCACSPLALGMMQGGRAASSGEGVRAGTRPIPAAGSRGGIWGSFCFGCICAGSSGGSRAVVTVG